MMGAPLRWDQLERLREWCRDMDEADGLARDESPISIWDEMIAALEAGEALANVLAKRTRVETFGGKKLKPLIVHNGDRAHDEGEPCDICEALDAWRQRVAPRPGAP